MQADLGDRSGDGLQRLVEPVDVSRCRARIGIRPDSCFQHVNIVPAALGATALRALAEPRSTPIANGFS